MATKSAKTGQTIFLAVLLVGLAFLVIRMIRTINPPPKPKTKTTASAPAKTESTKKPTRAAAKPKRGSANVEEKEKVLKDQYLNPNLFRTYQLETARNPFVQQEGWYAGVLEENLPGYLELKDSDYFESMDAYLPDIGFIYDGEREWTTASVNRSQNNSYSISGVSKDGLISTSIQLETDIPTSTSLNWSKNSQVPLEVLNNPESARRYNVRSEESDYDPLSGDQYDDPPAGGGLGIPGMVAPTQGDSITCSGVSLGYGRTSALLNINGHPTLVTDGSFIPPRFQVLEIKADGVVLVELQDGSSTWIPLGGS